MDNDPECVATLKDYRCLMPMAQEARKPIFRLKPADGAIGCHVQALQDCYRDFRALTRTHDQRANSRSDPGDSRKRGTLQELLI